MGGGGLSYLQRPLGSLSYSPRSGTQLLHRLKLHLNSVHLYMMNLRKPSKGCSPGGSKSFNEVELSLLTRVSGAKQRALIGERFLRLRPTVGIRPNRGAFHRGAQSNHHHSTRVP